MKFIKIFAFVFCLIFFLSSPALSKSEYLIDNPENFYGKISTIPHYELENPDFDWYIFATLSCPYCVKYFNILDESSTLKDNNIQVHWIMVPNNKAQGNILAGVYEEGTVDSLRNAFNDNPPSSSPQNEFINKVNSNVSAMRIIPKRTVPMNIGEDPTDGNLYWTPGVIEEERLGELVEWLKYGDKEQGE